MKVKNIMFGGVMASILMMGAASAAYPEHLSVGTDTETLASVKYVRGGINAAETYADNAITAIVGSGFSDTNTVAAAIATKANAADVYTKDAVDQAIADATSGIASDETVSALSSRVDSLEGVVGDGTSGLVKDVAGMAADLLLKADADDVYTKDAADAAFMDSDEVGAAITTAVNSGDIKDALDKKLDGTSISGDGDYIAVSTNAQTGAITVSFSDDKVATDWE